jgi:NADP-dependent 3-hydroxy acid dehydrogenase YdfG
MSFQGKTVVITGASKGIGRALSLELAKQGANLSLIARSQAELDSLQAEAIGLGAKCLTFVGSVANENDVNKTISETVAAYGGIDFMINNAGYGVFGATDTFSADTWSDVFDTNVKGTFMFSKAVLAPMKAAGQGHIINIASDVAKRVFDGGSLYCASKFAQDAFSAALRKEVRKDGIKVSVVYSGLVDTTFHPNPHSDAKQSWLTDVDMAGSILFIMSQPKHVVIDELMIHPLSQDY